MQMQHQAGESCPFYGRYPLLIVGNGGSTRQGDGNVSEEYRDHEGFERVDQAAAAEYDHARDECRDDEGTPFLLPLLSILIPIE